MFLQIFILTLLAASPAVAQSKFFSTPNRGGVEGAKQNVILTVLQNEQQRMNTCTAAGMIYAPTHPDADAGGCTNTAGRRLLADEVRLTGGSPLIRFSAEGAPAGQRNYQIQNSGGSLHFGPVDDNWAWQVGYISIDRNLNLNIPGRLTVGGAVKLAGASEACNGGAAGSIRYNASGQRIEFCDGAGWKAMGGVAGSIRIISSSASAWRWPVAVVTCNGDEQVTGGGGVCGGGAGDWRMPTNRPNGNGWLVYCDTSYSQNGTAYVYAICMKK